jgi:Xaa-Pro aminopeptidase
LICPKGDAVLEAGMTHTVEPGIYHPSIGGFRIEDDVLVSQEGTEVLGYFGYFDRDLL